MRKLNFGCGHEQPEDWINVDKVNYGQGDVFDIIENWPYGNKTFDVIVANHVLHMFTWRELTEVVLPRLRKCLVPGGVLRIIDMDPVIAFANYVKGEAKDLKIPDDVEPTIDGKFCQYLTWYGTRRNITTSEYLCELLRRVKFEEAVRVGYKATRLSTLPITELDTREAESYYVEAMKW